MLSCMNDSAHDREHIYRVLYNALEIARKRKETAKRFYEGLFDEVSGGCEKGRGELCRVMEG